MLLTVWTGTMVEVVWEVWTDSKEVDFHAVPGGDIARRVRDLSSLVNEDFFALAKLVLQINDMVLRVSGKCPP